jgi:hypothetical protein
LARLNVAVLGLERDATLLEHARKKAAQVNATKALLVSGDPTNFVSETKYSLAMVPGGALLRLLTLDEQRLTLMAIKRALAPGGRLVFDVPVLEPGLMTQVSGPVVRHVGDRTAVLRLSRTVDAGRQLLETLVECQWLGAAGQVESVQVGTRVERYCTPGEVELLLDACGYSYTFYGNFDRRPFGQDASRLLVEAERRG